MLPSDRYARLAWPVSLAIVAIGVATAWWYEAALSWDGAYYLFKALDLREPFVPLNRSVNAALQAPVLLAARTTSDMALLRRLFVLPYVLVPLVGLALSWWVARNRRPDLLVWPALSICLLSLPGQLFFTSEGPIATALFWPVLLALLLGPGRSDLPLVALLSAAVWTAHPIAVPLFLLAAAIVALRARQASSTRALLAVLALAFVAAAVARALVPLSGYENEALSVDTLLNSYRVAVAGRPFAAVLCAVLAGALLVGLPVPGDRSAPGARVATLAPALFALLAGLVLVPLVRDYGHWAHQLDYRFWQGALSLGAMLVATAEVVLRPDASSRRADASSRSALAVACALSFALVLGFQARSWQHATQLLTDALAPLPPGCTPLGSLEVLHGTPLDHWASVPYAVVLQGRAPQRILLDGDGCQAWRATGDFPIGSWDVRRSDSGWFNLPRP